MDEVTRPGSLVAVRARRQELIQLLSDGFANDLIGMEEFEDRLGRAHAAQSIADLDVLVAELAPLPAHTPSVALTRPLIDMSHAADVSETSLSASPSRIRSLFGNVERRGAWVVPARLSAHATFGNIELDFRAARFTAAVTDLEARVLFGNIEILVPPHLAVQCEGSSVFGNIESHGGHPFVDPERPVLRISGRVVFGNIEVHVRLPGESARGARLKRLK